MKRLASVILSVVGIFFSNISLAQKSQVPDTLLWGSRRYLVTVHRDVPSALMVYYQRTGKEVPFQSWSSENHRGHVATWEIVDNSLCLNSIQALRYKTPGSSLWSMSGIDTTVVPDYFEIEPLSAEHDGDFVVADWFSGILQLTLVTSDKNDLKSDEAKGFRLLNIIDGTINSSEFYHEKKINSLNDSQKKLLEKQQRYLNFYIRATADREEVYYKGHQGYFEQKRNTPTFVLSFFGNNPMLWPKNWENDDAYLGAPFGTWLLRNDSLFLTAIHTHWGDTSANQTDVGIALLGEGVFLNSDGTLFANWMSGDFVVHYGRWVIDAYGLQNYVISKTQKIRVKEGRALSSSFSPTSFEDDDEVQGLGVVSICNSDAVFSVDDNQIAESVGTYPRPKKAPYFEGDKDGLRAWFQKKSLTDPRAKERLFRVRIAFMVNCKGEASNFRVINKPKGELFEFSNMVLSVVENMPQLWHSATDRKGNPVDCWQVLEFTVSNGVLTNANYK